MAEYPSAGVAQASKKMTWKAVHIARAGPKPAVDTPEISGDILPMEACKIAKIAYLDDYRGIAGGRVGGGVICGELIVYLFQNETVQLDVIRFPSDI